MGFIKMLTTTTQKLLVQIDNNFHVFVGSSIYREKLYIVHITSLISHTAHHTWQLQYNKLILFIPQILDISSKPVSDALTDISSDATGHAACDIDYDCDQYECDSWDECEQDSFS